MGRIDRRSILLQHLGGKKLSSAEMVKIRRGTFGVEKGGFCCFSVTQPCPTLWPHGLQHTRLPCPSLSPRAFPSSHPLSRWCPPTISSSVSLFSFCLQSFQASGSFSNELAVHIRWPKYWIFTISPSNEYSGLLSFRIDWFDLLASQGTLRSSLGFINFLSIHTYQTELWERDAQ